MYSLNVSESSLRMKQQQLYSYCALCIPCQLVVDLTFNKIAVTYTIIDEKTENFQRLLNVTYKTLI